MCIRDSFYTGAFQQCARSIQSGRSLDIAAETLISMPGVQRVYLLGGDGRQVGDNLEREPESTERSRRYDPFAHFSGGDWFRRPYFQRAIAKPSSLQISRPYLSVRDAKRCVTFSMALQTSNETRVLCADLDYGPSAQRPSRRRPRRIA